MVTTFGYSESDFRILLENKPKEYLQKQKKCYFCGEPKIVKHHISYTPEKIIYLCRSCHSKLHFVIDKYHQEIVKQDSLGRKK